MAVTYRGPVEELQGTEWTVPDAVLAAGQGRQWIESQHRQALAEEAARVEAEQRQRELLAARLEQQRQQAAADQAAMAQEQGQAAADGQFRVELTELSQSVLAAGAAIVGKGELIEAQTREWEGRHEALVANSEQVVADAKEQVAFSNATTQANTDALNEHMTQQRQEQSAFEAKIWETIKSPEFKGEKGDKGERGMRGSGFAYIDADPTRMDQKSLGEKAFGAPPVPGDNLFRPVDGGLEIWRTPDAKGWAQVDFRTNKQELVSQQLSVLDKSTQVTASMVTTVGGGGGLGGGGGESLLSRTVASGGGAMLSESARWAIPLAAAGLPAPDACTITLELTAADGGNAGRKLFITGKAIYEGLATPPGSFTVYSELGELVGKVDVEFSIQSVPVTALPPGVPAATLPPGVLSAQVFARITSNSSGATQFLLAGAVSWLQPNAVIPADSTTLPQIRPAWGLI